MSEKEKEIIDIVDRYWKFDNGQAPMSSWHDKQDCLELLRSILSSSKISDKPKRVVMCGSSRFVDVMAVCAWLIERDEHAITNGLHLLPIWYAKDIPDHLAECENVSAAMDELHLRKIDDANEIFVVNRNDYIGDSTTNEVRYADKLRKKIRWYTSDPIGQKVESIIQEFLKRQSISQQSKEEQLQCLRERTNKLFRDVIDREWGRLTEKDGKFIDKVALELNSISGFLYQFISVSYETQKQSEGK